MYVFQAPKPVQLFSWRLSRLLETRDLCTGHTCSSSDDVACMCKISLAHASDTHDLSCSGHINIACLCGHMTYADFEPRSMATRCANCLYADPSQPRLGCSLVTYVHIYMRVYCHVPITCRGYVLEAHITKVPQGKLDAMCGVVLQGIANRIASCLCEQTS